MACGSARTAKNHINAPVFFWVNHQTELIVVLAGSCRTKLLYQFQEQTMPRKNCQAGFWLCCIHGSSFCFLN
jgi:hypothetical protein